MDGQTSPKTQIVALLLLGLPTFWLIGASIAKSWRERAKRKDWYDSLVNEELLK